MSSRVQAQTHARDDIWTLKRKNVRVAVASTLELNVISLWRDKFILFEAMSCFDDMSAYPAGVESIHFTPGPIHDLKTGV